MLRVLAPYYALSELSAETKASWRRELKAVIGDDPALRRAVTEALLWFGSMHDDRAVLFAVLELHDNGRIHIYSIQTNR